MQSVTTHRPSECIAICRPIHRTKRCIAFILRQTAQKLQRAAHVTPTQFHIHTLPYLGAYLLGKRLRPGENKEQ